MKRYLLMAGDNYYPEAGDRDWIGCFETYEEAEAQIKIVEVEERVIRGSNKGKLLGTVQERRVDGYKIDWYEIIDLSRWQKE